METPATREPVTDTGRGFEQKRSTHSSDRGRV